MSPVDPLHPFVNLPSKPANMIGQIKAILVLVVGSLLAACTDEPSIQTIPERLISTSGGYEVTHYGYVGDRRYEAGVAADELRDTDTIESAMPPRDAVNLALPALEAAGEGCLWC